MSYSPSKIRVQTKNFVGGFFLLFVLNSIGCSDESDPEPPKKEQEIKRFPKDADDSEDEIDNHSSSNLKPCDIEVILIEDNDGGYIRIYRPVYCFVENIAKNYPDPP